MNTIFDINNKYNNWFIWHKVDKEKKEVTFNKTNINNEYIKDNVHNIWDKYKNYDSNIIDGTDYLDVIFAYESKQNDIAPQMFIFTLKEFWSGLYEGHAPIRKEPGDPIQIICYESEEEDFQNVSNETYV